MKSENHFAITIQFPKSEIQLLRSLDWIEDYGAHVGGCVFLDMPEMGVEGLAEVLAIEPCPPLEEGEGRLVTGTFKHTSGEVYDLKLESESKPIGVTATHPFWSVDREAWVSAIDLEIGETLKTLAGTTIVESRSKREEPETVYNIEVEGDHVYRVGESGVLVHNASAKECGLLGERFGSQPKYTTEAAGNSGEQRTTLMQARLTKDRLSGGEDPKVYPPGWPANVNLPGLTRVARGHILANELGGKGNAKNLVPICQVTTNLDMWNKAEKLVRDKVNEGYTVDYVVSVSYWKANPHIPKKITIKAKGWKCGVDDCWELKPTPVKLSQIFDLSKCPLTKNG